MPTISIFVSVSVCVRCVRLTLHWLSYIHLSYSNGFTKYAIAALYYACAWHAIAVILLLAWSIFLVLLISLFVRSTLLVKPIEHFVCVKWLNSIKWNCIIALLFCMFTGRERDREGEFDVECIHCRCLFIVTNIVYGQ